MLGLLAIALLLAVALLLLAILGLLTVGVVRPVADHSHVRVGLAGVAARVLLPVRGILAGFVLWIRRLSGAHRVTSLRVRMWHVSGHMPVLPNVST
ncbi:hypothetical protein GCM10009850_058310 [Nonomuraea monospora]|uniref:Uncharacterized protein n=1 Tax=Nonomuraea monospora TaxID=568818 RepID=A0ABN3CLM4_9ACTN